MAEVHVFIIVIEPLVKTPQAFQQVRTKQLATSGLPVDRSFRIAMPPHIDVRKKQIGNVAEKTQIKSCDPFSPDRRKRPCGTLVRTICVQNAASESSRFGV